MKKEKTKSTKTILAEKFVALNPVRYSDDELLEFKNVIHARMSEARINVALLDAAIARHLNDPDDTCPTFKFSEDANCIMTRQDLEILSLRLKILIEQFKQALKRIQNKTYGICWISGELISKERLRSFPHTLMTADSKKHLTRLINHTS